jgi:sugar O-acyltransferase (sialic acid O-acetyltransferase NeuD family)
MIQALIGAGGHAREVCAHMGLNLPMFVEEKYYKKNTYNMLPLSIFDPGEYEVMVAIGDCAVKRRLIEEVLPSNTKYFTYIHPSAIVMDKNIHIGNGVFIGAGCLLTTNITIEDHVILNRYVQISHDSVIGKYCSLMPGVVLSGDVTLGNSVFIGSNSCVREKTAICSDVIIGLNSGVVKNIIVPGTYVGTPALLKKT